MSQVSNLTVPNGSGVEVRQGLNASIGAVATDHSGPTAPTNTFSGMKWRDTSTNPSVLKIRNDANTAWVEGLSALGASTAGKALLTAADKTAQRTVLELKGGALLDVSSNTDLSVDTSKLPTRGAVAGAIAAANPAIFRSTVVSANTGYIESSHGLGVVPDVVQFHLICASADMGYAIGDVITNASYEKDNGSAKTWTLWASSTKVGFSRDGGLWLASKGGSSSGGLDLSKWNLQLLAWVYPA